MPQLCECGCGSPAPVGPKGQQRRFVGGHNVKGGHLRKPRVGFECAHCGKVTQLTAAGARGRKYCSKECRDEHRRSLVGPANPRFERIGKECPICRKQFQIIKSRLVRRRCGKRVDCYCSVECGREGRRRKIRGVQRLRGPGKGIDTRRKAAKERDGNKCRVCGFKHFVHVHHIVPKKDGGTDDASNLITLCPNHHAMTHAGMLSVENLRAAILDRAALQAALPGLTRINYRAKPRQQHRGTQAALI